MENIILSILLIKSATVYEIKMFIKKCLTTVCSDSLGSIQAGIKKLQEKECVVVREYVENNLLKKEYSITDKGVEQFKQWIEVPMNLEKVRNMEEGKFFFLGMADRQVRIKSIEGYIGSLKAERDKLYTIMTMTEETKEEAVKFHEARIREDEALTKHLLQGAKEENIRAVVENIYDYQIYSLEYGLKKLEQDIVFYEGILEKERSKEVNR